MADYYNVTTNTGDAEIAAAIASNNKLAITHIAFGDGNGAVPTPSKIRTSLIREVHRQAVTKYERHPTNANWIVIETIIPSNIGGFWVREMGVIANGKLISHGSHAPFEKVADPTGVSEYRIKFTQNIKDGNVVNITLDQSLIYASQAWVNENYIPRNEIIDDTTTDDSKKPLSAKQGKKLQYEKVDKAFIRKTLGNTSAILAPAGYNFNDIMPGDYLFFDLSKATLNPPPFSYASVFCEGVIGDHEQRFVTARDYFTGQLAVRAKQNGIWSDWHVQAVKTDNVASATKLQTPRTISLIGDGAGSASFDGSANTSINLTLNDVNNSAGTYGANNLEIPTFTLNKKGLLTSAINRQFPSATTSQYGAAILYDGLDSYSNSHAATANIVRHLNAAKVDINKSFNDAFGSDVDNYIAVGNLKGFTSCADFPIGSRMIVDVPALPDMPNLGSSAIYFETKRTYIHPGKLQIAYGYNNGRTATRSASTGGGYSDWVYTADTSSISRYRQDLDATRIYSPNSQKVLSITDSGVDVPDLRVSGSVYSGRYKSNNRVWFTDHTENLAQGVNVGSLFIGDRYSEDIYTHGQGIYAKGVIESVAGFKGKLLAKDSRVFKPYHAESGGIAAYFVTEWGLNNDNAGGSYGDFLSLNTYGDASVGMQNGLFFDKGGKRIVHYQSVFGSGNWGSGKTLAYAEDVLSINGGTMNAPINFNLSHADGAFHKLIEGSTSTDGGYIAVGNHGSDKGYLELGTIDDPDAAIYARKRNAANTVLEEAVILGSDGNTSFPHSVLIHNTPSGYGTCGFVKGNGDNAVYDACNIDITSWFGVGIKASNTGERTVVFNARTGDISNKGSINTVGVVNGKGLGVTSADGLGSGLSLYDGAMHGMPTYGIAFAQTQHHGGYGYVDGDWATYFTMEGAYNRGWIFKSHSHGNVASVSANGNAHFNGKITAEKYQTRNKLIAENGYVPLTNGMILQWGKAWVWGDSDLSITFPIAFPGAFFSAQASLGMNNWSTRGDAGCGAHSATKTGMVLRNGAGESGDVFWLAIGN